MKTLKDYEALSRKHFDGQAAEYDQCDTYYYSQNGKISCRDITEQIKSIPYEALLDVGCGMGFLIDLLARQKQARYCGLDLSDKMMDESDFRDLLRGCADRSICLKRVTK